MTTMDFHYDGAPVIIRDIDPTNPQLGNMAYHNLVIAFSFKVNYGLVIKKFGVGVAYYQAWDVLDLNEFLRVMACYDPSMKMQMGSIAEQRFKFARDSWFDQYRSWKQKCW